MTEFQGICILFIILGIGVWFHFITYLFDRVDVETSQEDIRKKLDEISGALAELKVGQNNIEFNLKQIETLQKQITENLILVKSQTKNLVKL